MKYRCNQLIILSLVALTAAAGCKKKAKAAAPEPTASAISERTPASETVIAEGATKQLLLSLRRVHFGLDTSELNTESRDGLVAAAEALASLPSVSLYVEGHTDDRGTAEYNVALSERRAQAVVDYLKRLGVSPARLVITPYGKERPIAPGEDAMSRAENRRVDFRVRDGKVEFILEPATLLDDGGKPLPR